jgi:transcriptional regulator with XRE-family HTH domain
MNLRKNYGTYITEKRVEKGLTMRKISEKIGVSAITLSNIELEKGKYSLHNLTKYLKELDIPLSEVIQGDGAIIECQRGDNW